MLSLTVFLVHMVKYGELFTLVTESEMTYAYVKMKVKF